MSAPASVSSPVFSDYSVTGSLSSFVPYEDRWSPATLLHSDDDDAVPTSLRFDEDLHLCDDTVPKYPLHVAALYGRFEEVKRLLALSPDDVDSVNEKGQTAVHVIVENALAKIPSGEHVRFLKLFRAKKSEAMEISDQDGRSPLHLAVLHADEATIEYLICNFGDLITEQDDQGFSPLHLAVSAGRHEVVKILFEYDFDSQLHLVNENGHSPFFLACLVDLKMLKIIWAVSFAQLNDEDKFGMTPLVAVLNEGCTDVAAHLLKWRAAPPALEKLNKMGHVTLAHAKRLAAAKVKRSNKRLSEDYKPDLFCARLVRSRVQ